MTAAIDWEQLGQQVGSLRVDGESGGSREALRAIELLLGEDQLRAAVDYYVAGHRGCELARHVLWQLHPWSAMQRCYEIYHSDADVEPKVSAIELLRVVADRRALAWVEGFLADPNPGIQIWGMGVLDQLLWSRLVDTEECEELLRAGRAHQNEQVRKTEAFIQSYLREREQPVSPPVEDEGSA